VAVSAGSANTNLVPNSSASLIPGGSNAQRTIKVVPVANQTGTHPAAATKRFYRLYNGGV